MIGNFPHQGFLCLQPTGLMGARLLLLQHEIVARVPGLHDQIQRALDDMHHRVVDVYGQFDTQFLLGTNDGKQFVGLYPAWEQALEQVREPQA